MVVEDGRCATVSWVPIAQHTETTSVCSGPAAASMSRSSSPTNRSPARPARRPSCPATAYLLPPGAPGPALDRHLLQVSPAEKVALAGEAWAVHHGGRATTPVTVEHTPLTLTFDGGEQAPTRPTSGSSRPRTDRAASTRRSRCHRGASTTARPWATLGSLSHPTADPRGPTYPPAGRPAPPAAWAP